MFIGINDYGWGGAEAQAAGRSHAMPRCIDPATVPEQIAGAAPADAVKRFWRGVPNHVAQHPCGRP